MTGRPPARLSDAGASEPGLRLLSVGSTAVLVEPTDARDVIDLYRRLQAARPAGVTELVPAAATVLVVFDEPILSRPGVVAWVEQVAAAGQTDEGGQSGLAIPSEQDAAIGLGRDEGDGRGYGRGVGDGHERGYGREVGDGPERGYGRGVGGGRGRGPAADGDRARADRARSEGHLPLSDQVVELPVRYDGPDLAIVAELSGASVDDVIAAHLGQLWTAAFIGFAPGFAYLTGEDDRLTVPRRESPRAVVPAGSVALAAGYCGVYPRESPGGWHVIGSTDAVLWDVQRSEPALLAPGTRVRFVRER